MRRVLSRERCPRAISTVLVGTPRCRATSRRTASLAASSTGAADVRTTRRPSRSPPTSSRRARGITLISSRIASADGSVMIRSLLNGGVNASWWYPRHSSSSPSDRRSWAGGQGLRTGERPRLRHLGRRVGSHLEGTELRRRCRGSRSMCWGGYLSDIGTSGTTGRCSTSSPFPRIGGATPPPCDAPSGIEQRFRWLAGRLRCARQRCSPVGRFVPLPDSSVVPRGRPAAVHHRVLHATCGRLIAPAT